MRKDMQKVIVERPRRGSGAPTGREPRPKRRGEEWEGYPKQSGMHRWWHRGGRKEQSDHLNPLWRYFDKQVGRPWDKVYSEMSEHLNQNVLGFHVRSHIDQHVKRHVEIIDGVPYEKTRAGEFPLWLYEVDGLYVHPKDGLLKRHRRSKKRRKS